MLFWTWYDINKYNRSWKMFTSCFLPLHSFWTLSWCRCTCGRPSWAAAPSSGPPSCASPGRVVMALPVWPWPSSWTLVRPSRRCARPGWPEKGKRPRGKTKWGWRPLSVGSQDGRVLLLLTSTHNLKAWQRAEEQVTGWKEKIIVTEYIYVSHTHTTLVM